MLLGTRLEGQDVGPKAAAIMSGVFVVFVFRPTEMIIFLSHRNNRNNRNSLLTKTSKNSSDDVLALRAFVSLSWICASEQAPAQTTASTHIASQRKTSTEEKTPLRYATLKKRLRDEKLKIEH